MIERVVLVTICMWQSLVMSAQLSVQGKVISIESGETIPFVHVYNPALATGTVSNDEGAFRLEVDSLPIALAFSHATYNTHEQLIVSVTEPTVISLEPKSIVLDPVMVFSGDLSDLIEVTVENGLERLNKKTPASLFYRQITKTEASASEVVEAFFTGEISADGLKKLNLENGRFGKVRSDTTIAYPSLVNFYYMSSIPVVQEEINDVIFPLNEKFKKYYKYSIKEVFTGSNDQMIVVVSFDPVYFKKPIFRGDVYIDTDHKVVTRLNGAIHNALGLSFEDKRVSTDEEVYKFDVRFNQTLNQKAPSFYSIKVTLDCDYLYEDKVMPMNATSYMVAYDYSNGAASAKMKKVSAKGNLIEEIRKSASTKEFWKENSILKRTSEDQLIIDWFESNGYFENDLEN